MNHPLFLLLMLGMGVYLAKLWHDDRAAARHGQPNPRGLPGATDAPARASVIAAVGALAILVLETWGEGALGIAAEQSHMTWLFALCSIVAAPIVEEIIFRGYLVIEGRGRIALWAGAVGASLVFALLHPFLWSWGEDGFALRFAVKGWFSTAAVFAMSLWLYAVRFASWNPQRSLLPCFVGHCAKNIGVVVVKAGAGFMGGLW